MTRETEAVFSRREEGLAHLDSRLDMLQYEYVRRGDLRSVPLAMEIFNSPNQGKLSDDPLRNVIYRFVCATMLVTRYALDGGLNMEEAYALSDTLILRADNIRKVEEIYPLLEELFRSFTERVARAQRQKAGPLPVRQAKEYISSHLNEKITIAQLASIAGLTPNYFSTLFRRETGLSPADYIREKRLESAEDLLLYSAMPVSQIAQTLAFSSDSHFIQVFHDRFGISPANYRRDKASWSVTKSRDRKE